MNKAGEHIVIQKRSAPASLTEKQLRQIAEQAEAVAFDIPGDSQVKRCYFFPQAKQAIFDWALQSLQEKAVPEVGGFLLGQFARSSEGKYLLVIMHFIAATEVSFQSANRLRLGPAAMLALDKALDAYPAEQLLGWFHTHPGHTPFFSDIDLATHWAFFKADFHIAMVTDPCLEPFPTVILAKKQNGDMTTEWNHQDWIAWNESEVES